MVVEQPGVVGEFSGRLDRTQQLRVGLVGHVRNREQAAVDVAGVQRIVVGVAVVDIAELVEFAHKAGIVGIGLQIEDPRRAAIHVAPVEIQKSFRNVNMQRMDPVQAIGSHRKLSYAGKIMPVDVG